MLCYGEEKALRLAYNSHHSTFRHGKAKVSIKTVMDCLGEPRGSSWPVMCKAPGSTQQCQKKKKKGNDSKRMKGREKRREEGREKGGRKGEKGEVGTEKTEKGKDGEREERGKKKGGKEQEKGGRK